MKNLLLLFFVFGMISAASAQEVYYSEGFDDGLPADWFAEGEWSFGAGPAVSSTYFAVPDSGTGVACFNDDGLGASHVGSGRLSSGPIDLTAAAGEVWFQASMFFPNLDYGGADETVSLLISTDMGASFAEYHSFDGTGNAAFGPGFIEITEFAGSTIVIALEYNDGATWNYGVAFDEILVQDQLTGIPSRAYGIDAGSATIMDRAKAGEAYKLSGFITNTGLEAIESFDVIVSDGTNEIVQNMSGMDIGYNQVARYALSEGVVVPEGDSDWTVSIANVNGNPEADEDTSNNAAGFSLNGMTNLHPDKAVMVEEATGTWCTWCPRGTVFLEEMSKRFGSNFVGVAVHNSDPMALAEYDSAITSFPGFEGFPSVVYNREEIIDASEIVSPSLLDMTEAPIAGITVGGDYDEATGDLVTSIEVNFLQDVSAEYNVSVVLTEDGLSGTTSDWAQVNAYSGGGQGPMGGFENLPSPVPASLMIYDHVGVALIGDYEGVPNVVTGDFVAGDVKSYRFSAADVSNFVTDNVHVIGVITDASNGEVVNAQSVSFDKALANGLSTGIAETYDNTYAEVLPNLVVDQTTIFMSIEEAKNVKASLVNSIGQTVASQNYGQQIGQVQLQFDMTSMTAGIYYLHIQADDKLITKKLTKVQ